MDRDNVHERRFFEGVQRYVRENPGWRTFNEETLLGMPAGELPSQPCDGIVGFLRNEAMAQAIQAAHIPAVNVSRMGMDSGIPAVMQDFTQCGRSAAEYFIRRGFRRFGYLSRRGGMSRDLRLGGFRERLGQEGFSCNRFSQPDPLPQGGNWAQYQEELLGWLESLPKPVAILARHDRFAARILAVCEMGGFRVPAEVAVMGWGNDETVCPFTNPALSSIESQWEETGYESAHLLDRLMSGEKAASETVLLKAGNIVERQSSDVLAVGDPVVVKAVSFIEEHACDPIRVDDVVRHVSVNRRRLERLFRRVLHRPPNTEIIRIRIQRVRQLLTQTDMSMTEIARLCGYPDHRCLGITFRREMGMSPTLFRRQARRRNGTSSWRHESSQAPASAAIGVA
ncbi:DNA-binding transcriptional regulator [Candidatus Sumerlaeota bacterium]|nr:DNA-binding transcriptional regulator [Candidatus Sumerlaeota bacterium]